MVNVWRKASTFDPERASVSTWIFTIARNLRVDHFRRQDARLVYGAEDEAEAQADTLPALDEQVLTTGTRIAACGWPWPGCPTSRRWCCAFPFSKSGLMRASPRNSGIPLGTVKSRVRLAVNHLRRLLNGIES